jgi:tRNA pseudouridine32 synthase / 23S rRNA pseudouridine746 synthase
MFKTVYHSASCLIISKKPGVSFHATDDDEGILQIIREAERQGLIPEGERLYPVHRLDKVTSGILVFARGRKNAELIGNEFRHGRVTKVYIALSDRKPSKKQGTVIGDMEKGRGSAWILKREKNNPAITRFTSHHIPDRRPGLRLYVLWPKTGKTHQLRVAMKSLSAPILGDPLYGRYDLARLEDRTYLHATGLRLNLPGESIEVIDLPEDGEEFLSEPFKNTLSSIGNIFPD